MTTSTKAKPGTHVLQLTRHDDETIPQAFARHTLSPELQAGNTLTLLNGAHPDVDAKSLIAELRKQSEAVSSGNLERGESMLTAQAHTLDALFHMLADRSRRNMGEYTQSAELYMRLAFKAQSQCRSTWEAINEMKNPRHVAFVRQANMGNNLQVNNGTPPAALPSRAEINDISPNKLLEADNGQRLDARATGTAGGANREMEAVGAVNRTKVGER